MIASSIADSSSDMSASGCIAKSAILSLPDLEFQDLWRNMHQENKDALDAAERAQCIDRFVKLTPHVSNSVSKLVRQQQSLGSTIPRVLDVDIVCGADLAPEAIDWLWKWYFARGMFHLLAGAPGTGKTTLALAIAAALTSGGKLPDGTRCKPCAVLMWSGEDDITRTLLPRFIAMGGNRDRMFFVTGTVIDGESHGFDPSKDMDMLMAAAAPIENLGLLLLDPVVMTVAGDSNRNGDVRRGLQPVIDLAQRLHAVALGVSHFTKGSQGKDPIERVTGSLAFAAAARVVFAAAKKTDEEGNTQRLFTRAKSNLGPDGGGFTYSLEQAPVPGYPQIEASRVLWEKAIEGTAFELLAEPEENGAGHDCENWLRDLLTEEIGGMKASDVLKLADQNGFPRATVYRAKTRLKVVAKTKGFGTKRHAVWSLVSTPHHDNNEIDGTNGTKSLNRPISTRPGEVVL